MLCCVVCLQFISANLSAQEIGQTVNFGVKETGFTPCGSDKYETYLNAKYPGRATKESFENWLAKKIKEGKREKNNNTVVTIPVVFHVMHDGDAVGVSENLSAAQVESQITVLNQDFRRILNTPGYNDHPDGADIEIEFCLAQRDPDGEPTTGINRINAGVESWSMEAIEMSLKPQTQWDPENYLNIWVCRFGSGLEGLGGYSFFPQQSGLDGIPNIPGMPPTADGVVLSYTLVGSSDIYPQGNYQEGNDKGRVATHEIGHYFGLRHIWGDEDGCMGNDFCNDTPAANMNITCTPVNSCTADALPDMIENYMDYTPDACKNIFTNDQKARIQAVLQNSPRRNTLANSDGCVFPADLNIDGMLRIFDAGVWCNDLVRPGILLINKGLNTITSATFTYRVNEGPEQTFSWTGSVVHDASVEIILDPVSAALGNHTLHVSIATINGAEDEYSPNNTKSMAFTVVPITDYNTETVKLELRPDLFGADITWDLSNSSGTVLYSGGPYSNTNTIPPAITETFNVQDDECYRFVIRDAFGDGICCQNGNGSYTLRTDNNTLIATGGNYGVGAFTNFNVNNTLSTPGANPLEGLTIYPVPVGETLTISNSGLLPDAYVIYNMLGQEVISGNIENAQDMSVNTAALSKGLYVIKVSMGAQSQAIKFLKE